MGTAQGTKLRGGSLGLCRAEGCPRTSELEFSDETSWRSGIYGVLDLLDRRGADLRAAGRKGWKCKKFLRSVQGVMLTKREIRHLTVDLNQMASVALIRADAGKPFSGDAVIKRLRELGLIEKASWNPTEDGRQVVGELVGVPYTPKYIDSALEPSAEMTKKLVAVMMQDHPETSGSSDGSKFKPHVDVKGVGTVTQRRTICVQCREDIPKGAKVLWVMNEGVFHEDCVETS